MKYNRLMQHLFIVGTSGFDYWILYLNLHVAGTFYLVLSYIL